MDFSALDALAAKLRSLRPLNRAELARLRGEFVIENTYNSTAIEGNTLTLGETAFIIRENVTIGGKSVREHLEVIGHREAFDYVFETAGRNAAADERVIKNIHALVLSHDRENKGVYRRVPVRIAGSTHAPAPPHLIQPRMETLLGEYEQLKRGKHIMEAISEFHLRFEGIHPFIDGNGRTGRLIMNLELIKAGLLPIDIKFTDRKRYYDCFAEFFDTGDAGAFTRMAAEYEIRELEKYIEITKEVSPA